MTVKGREEDRESKEYRIGVKGKSRYLASARKDGTQKNIHSYIKIQQTGVLSDDTRAERVC